MQVFTVTTNAQNTLQHFQWVGQVPSKHFIFLKGAPVFVEGVHLCHGTMASPSHILEFGILKGSGLEKRHSIFPRKKDLILSSRNTFHAKSVYQEDLDVCKVIKFTRYSVSGEVDLCHLASPMILSMLPLVSRQSLQCPTK